MKNNIFDNYNPQKTLYKALLDASNEHGKNYEVIEDIQRKPLKYRDIILQSIVLGNYIKRFTTESEHIGIMLPNVTALPILFFALQFTGRVPAMLNFSSGAYAINRSCKTAKIKTIYTSRLFIDKAKLESVIKE